MLQDTEITNENSSAARPPLRFREAPPSPPAQRLIVFTLFLFGFVVALTGLVGGFMYGDSYGRKHAQYDNPVLREYYAGQCYSYWENSFRKTVRSTLDKPTMGDQEAARLDEIRQMIQSLQHDVSDLATQKSLLGGGRKKVAASGLSQ